MSECECVVYDTRWLRCVFMQAQFGRRWTKIAKLVGSRSVLQVKSYARQYFKLKVTDSKLYLLLFSLFKLFHHQECILGKLQWRIKQSFLICFQAKSEPRAAAPSAGPELHSQPPQATSSHASALANTVRIEKLSDEEDEEVDITDDLSDDGDHDNKPQLVLKTELCELEQHNPTEEQGEADLTETKEPTLRSPQPASSLPCSEKTWLDKRGDEIETLLPPNNLQTASELITEEKEGQSSQSQSSALTCQLEEACSDNTGKTAPSWWCAFFFLMHS